MPQLTPEVVQKNNELLAVAVQDNLDAALAQHGQYITGTEAAALARLSNEELVQLARINARLYDTANRLGAEAADWGCGLVC